MTEFYLLMDREPYLLLPFLHPGLAECLLLLALWSIFKLLGWSQPSWLLVLFVLLVLGGTFWSAVMSSRTGVFVWRYAALYATAPIVVAVLWWFSPRHSLGFGIAAALTLLPTLWYFRFSRETLRIPVQVLAVQDDGIRARYAGDEKRLSVSAFGREGVPFTGNEEGRRFKEGLKSDSQTRWTFAIRKHFGVMYGYAVSGEADRTFDQFNLEPEDGMNPDPNLLARLKHASVE